jgi:diguanylate cyclase (GGDEF)-like protein
MTQTKHAPPFWLNGLGRLVKRLGVGASTALLTLVATLSAVAITQVFISLAGQGNRWLATLISSACGLTITPVLGYLMLTLVKHIEADRDSMRRFATQDALTGLFNRRHFMEMVEREWSRARRYQTMGAMLLLDLDHFKQVNDRFGHLCGDAVLVAVAEVMQETLRHPDVSGRFGGEEFIAFLPQTDELGGVDVAERLRQRIEATPIQCEGQSVAVTVSVGVAAMRPEHLRLDHLIRDADAAMYEAKAAGRNCVRAAKSRHADLSKQV